MAETWLTITTAKVRASLSDGEWDVFANAALTPESADPVAQAIRNVVARIQGDVGASGKNTVGPAGMVPPELEQAALILTVEALSARVPQSGIVWDDIRKGLLTEAKALLKEIRSGDYQTTAPETVGTVGAVADAGGYGGQAIINFHDTDAVTDADY